MFLCNQTNKTVSTGGTQRDRYITSSNLKPYAHALHVEPPVVYTMNDANIVSYPIHMLQIQEHTNEQNTELTRSSCLRTSSTNRPAF